MINAIGAKVVVSYSRAQQDASLQSTLCKLNCSRSHKQMILWLLGSVEPISDSACDTNANVFTCDFMLPELIVLVGLLHRLDGFVVDVQQLLHCS